MKTPALDRVFAASSLDIYRWIKFSTFTELVIWSRRPDPGDGHPLQDSALRRLRSAQRVMAALVDDMRSFGETNDRILAVAAGGGGQLPECPECPREARRFVVPIPDGSRRIAFLSGPGDELRTMELVCEVRQPRSVYSSPRLTIPAMTDEQFWYAAPWLGEVLKSAFIASGSA